MRAGHEYSNALSQRSTITETRTESIISPSHLSKSKVYPLDQVQPKQLSFILLPPTSNEGSPNIHSDEINPTSDSLNIKFQRLQTWTIVLGTLLGICALAGLAIGLYFIISTNLKTASTTTTTPACAMALCWNPSGVTVFGTGSSGSSSDHLNSPNQVVINSSSIFYVVDRFNHRIQKFTASAVGTTIAGQSNGQGGSGSYYLNQPLYVLFDTGGNFYVSDSQNYQILYFTSGSLLGALRAGTPGSQGSSLSQLDTPHGLALDSRRGILYIADTNNHRIMAYPSSGAVSGIVAFGITGSGGSAYNQLNAPTGLYFDVSSNSLYIANCNSHNILRWVVNATTWTLIAGNGNGQSGFTSILLNNPTDLIFDYMGNLYVADSSNNRIQFFLSGQFNGTTIAGITGVSANTANTLSSPQSMALDSNLNLYVADSGNNRIQRFQRY